MKVAAMFLVLLSSALVLVGCGVTSFPEFEVDQTDRDVLPDVQTRLDVDPESTRYVGEIEGTDLYLASGDDAICLIQVREQDWEQGCGAGEGVGIELESGTLIEVGTFSFPEEQVGGRERTKLSESVTVISSP